MKYSLLRMAQLIASSMDSDEFNDIEDSVESGQIVDIIEQVYNDIVSQVDFPEQWDLLELQPSLSVIRPTVMFIPEGVQHIEWIQYDHADAGDTSRNWRPVLPMERKMFFNRMNSLDSSRSEVYRYDYLVGNETFDVRGWNDRPPTYYTTVDNRSLIFDSYKASQGATLVGNRSKAYGQVIKPFERDNDWIADLEPKQYTLFFNEAKAQCFIDLKQAQNIKAERNARRGWTQAARKKENTKASAIKDWLPNYGRRR